MSVKRPNSELDVGRIGIDRTDLPPFDAGPIDVRQWFAPHGDRPLELEIGSGKGTFLVQQAELFSNVNFIGIEYVAAIWRYAADRLRRNGLNNVRLVHAEAQGFIRHYLPDACLRQVHIYFPDPWPKKKHHKRRLIQRPLLEQLHRTLITDGVVRIATDHSDYFQWIERHAGEANDLFDVRAFEPPASAGDDEIVGSNFERKYRREGRPFHGLSMHKRA